MPNIIVKTTNEEKPSVLACIALKNTIREWLFPSTELLQSIYKWFSILNCPFCITPRFFFLHSPPPTHIHLKFEFQPQNVWGKELEVTGLERPFLRLKLENWQIVRVEGGGGKMNKKGGGGAKWTTTHFLYIELKGVSIISRGHCISKFTYWFAK